MAFINIMQYPKQIILQLEGGTKKGFLNEKGEMHYNDIAVETQRKEGNLSVYLTAQTTPVLRIIFTWECTADDSIRILGDAWERGYGDLEWRGIVSERIMPWYMMVYESGQSNGYGVKTGANAMCSWQMDGKTITLSMDVRNGGNGVRLKGRRLLVADIVCRKGIMGETAYETTKLFCKQMCEKPRLPRKPVYGSNDWYYAYGNSSANDILRDAELLAELAPQGENRPYIVIDDGWQVSHNTSCTGGPWNKGNYKFPDMESLAKSIYDLDINPGIWMRPLCTTECYPPECLLDFGKVRFKEKADHEFYLDPSHPYVLDSVETMIRGIREWGYKLLKHDFTTYDIFGRWGFEMGNEMTNRGWNFYDTTKTTAEIILGLYGAIRKGAGEDMLIIGCNTISHLAAGIFEIQRTGDDTSGLEWERTRKMGINTLAFRMPQNNTFYAADADCAGLTEHIEWEKNKQWISLLTTSGTPMLLSANPKILTEEQKEYLREAFKIASEAKNEAVPVDWMITTCPEKWDTAYGRKEFCFN
ncbi:MAG: alpha-amylase family protein [Mobilitalea sp.]